MADVVAVFQDSRIQEFFKRINGRLENITGKNKKIFASIASVFVYKDYVDHFENEMGPKGKWKPWSKMYAEHMAKIGKGGNRILQDTGFLRGAFHPASYRTQKDGILWFNPAKTKSGDPYAARHDENRPFMWLSDRALDDIADASLDHLMK